MKLLVDFFPILLFFLAYKFFGIYWATGVAIAAAGLQVGYVRLRWRRWDKLQLMTLFLITVLGGATLFFHEEIFIKWKPTLINWLFAAVFLGSQYVGKAPIIQRLMKQQISLPAEIWRRLNLSWVVFFLLSGLANLYVVYHFDTNTWVNFKLFGLMGLTIIFIILQAFYLARHLRHES